MPYFFLKNETIRQSENGVTRNNLKTATSRNVCVGDNVLNQKSMQNQFHTMKDTYHQQFDRMKSCPALKEDFVTPKVQQCRHVRCDVWWNSEDLCAVLLWKRDKSRLSLICSVPAKLTCKHKNRCCPCAKWAIFVYSLILTNGQV